ncbi:MAG: hypothetical protein QOD99_1742 [Chthoniobacter sp.]|jgi:hypothetical protein|nr:hypothetical protein [Chthoniobacter sp.]
MLSEDNFNYAIENTRVILAPQRRIETFGSTTFRFYLVSELMDRANEVRVRDGRIHAERPQILTPGHLARLALDGFGEKAQAFAEWLERRSEQLAILKYGFQFRKTDVVERIVQGSLENVCDQVRGGLSSGDETLTAVIQGVDDAWEVCLLKFTVDLIQQSAGGNVGEFRKRGLI